MPLRLAKTYQKIISKGTIPLTRQVMGCQVLQKKKKKLRQKLRMIHLILPITKAL